MSNRPKLKALKGGKLVRAAVVVGDSPTLRLMGKRKRPALKRRPW